MSTLTPVTKESLSELPYGTVFHYGDCEARIERWRANGRLREWKTRPEEFRLPIKHGLRAYGYIDETNAHMFHLERECPNA